VCFYFRNFYILLYNYFSTVDSASDEGDTGDLRRQTFLDLNIINIKEEFGGPLDRGRDR
jgi:hypothetical protein